MGSINIPQIEKQIFTNKELQKKMQFAAEDLVNKEVEKLLKNFEDHPVTKELQSGANSTNISGTLSGKGNLFSFIGFNQDFDPISPVVNLIKTIKLVKSSLKINKNSIEYKVNVPDQKDFETISKLPWENGRSWLYDIERSISGLGNYIYGKFSKSRSGTGAQSKNLNNNLTFKPTRYFKSMMEDFLSKIK